MSASNGAADGVEPFPSVASSDAPWRRRGAEEWTVLTLVAIVTLFGAALRGVGLTESLWLDELHTSWVVDGGDQLAARARMGNQSPLNFWIPWLSERCLGRNELALRLPSWLAGVALLPALFVVARRASGSRWGALCATVAAACDPLWIFYAQEARGYALVQLLSLGHLALFVTRLQRPATGWIRFAWLTTGILLFYLHYTTALVLCAELVAVVVFRAATSRESGGIGRRTSWSEWATDFGLLLMACAWEWPTLREVTARRGNWSRFLEPESPWTVFDWRGYVVAPLLVGLVVLGWRWARHRQPLCWRTPDAWPSTLALWIGVPWLLACVATWCDVAQLLRYRYLIGSATGLPLVIALAWAATASRGGRRWMALVLSVHLFLQPGPLREFVSTGHIPPQRGEDWRSAVERMARDLESDGRPVFLFAGLVEDWQLPTADPALVDFCRFPLAGLYHLPRSLDSITPRSSSSEQPWTSDDLAAIRRHGSAWLIVRGDTSIAEALARPARLALAGHSEMRLYPFAGVTVVELVSEPSRASRPV